MQTLHSGEKEFGSARGGPLARRDRPDGSSRARVRSNGRLRPAGFTMVELMVVLAVVAVVAAAAFAGLQQDKFSGQHKRFVDDVTGIIIQARNFAIDEQTQVAVDIDSLNVVVTALDQTTNMWQLVNRTQLEGDYEHLLLMNNAVCIHGLQAGVQTPSQAVAVMPPGGCSAGIQQLMFEPDGTFTDPLGTFSGIDYAGATIWIGDSRTGTTKWNIVQIFPGGLIRSMDISLGS